MSIQQIDPRSTVSAVIASNPATIAVFNAFGVDTCCGGVASLEEAARQSRIALDDLVDALDEAVNSPLEGP